MRKGNEGYMLIYTKRKITGNWKRRNYKKNPKNYNSKPFELPLMNSVYFDK